MRSFSRITRVAWMFAGAAALWAPAALADRVHEGFHFRGLLGPDYLSTTARYDAIDLTTTVSGPGAMFELFVGGAVAPGAIVGGTVGGHAAEGPKFASAGSGSVDTSDDLTLSYSTLAVFFDYYPAPSGGLHFLASLGAGTTSLSYTSGSVTTGSALKMGPAFGLGVGYDAWVSSHWSLGGLLRYQLVKPGSELSTESVTSHAVGLGFSVSYN